jgi:cation diffusion facilitator family transporter
MTKEASSKKVVYAALAGNLLVTATKFTAAWWTGSSAMRSEAVHSFVDTSNQALLLYGMAQARRRPDEAHPLGYGREVYSWSFIVALMIFALGAVGSVVQGIQHVLDPEPITDPIVNYIVLGCAFLFEGSSWWIARKEIKAAKGRLSYYEAVRRSKDPPAFMVLLEDTAALIGLAIALVGTLLAQWLHNPIYDGLASIAIGLLLGVTGYILARETKDLLIGESAGPAIEQSIMAIAEACPDVDGANGLLTFQFGPRQIFVTLSLEFADELNTEQIEKKVAHLETLIRETHPDVMAVFVKPQTPASFRKARMERYGLAVYAERIEAAAGAAPRAAAGEAGA